MSSKVTRRSFMGVAIAAGATAVAGRGGLEPTPLDARTRATPVPPTRSPAPFELEETTVADLQKAMREGRFTSQRLTELYLQRIDEMDQRGPAINAVLTINPDAGAQAAQADSERAAGKVRGPLHGIPVLIKDNISTADKMPTTAGSLALAGVIAPRDAFIVQRLRQAGAVIIGKTNLSEWANFRSSHSSSGWSGCGGQTRNSYVLDRSPSGSSSGSGAATAANFCVVSVGTETDGSIVSPSSANSLVGLKPTLGLVSRAGIVPIAHSQDTAGPMCRTVADAAALLTVLAGADPNDAATLATKRANAPDFTAVLDRGGLKGARIGLPRESYYGYSASTDKIMDHVIQLLKDEGAVIVDPANIRSAGKFGDSEFEVLLYEFKADLNTFLATLGPGAPVKSLADVIAFNDAHRDTSMPFFGQEIMLQAQKKGPLTSEKYRKALAKNHRLTRTEGIDATLNKHRLDALVAPTQGPTWFIDLVNGDGGSGGSSSSPAAVAGYPSITVPAGYVYGLPVGVSFFGRAHSEATIIKLAYAYEQASKVRRPPTFASSAELPPSGRPAK